MLIEYVNEIRGESPRIGSPKLYQMCVEKFGESMVYGRDTFIGLLREKGLMLRLKKRRYAKTTDSEHGMKTYPNLIRAFVPSAPNQLWVSDITYVDTMFGFVFLTLITDAYTREIVGRELAKSLHSVHTQHALSQAINAAIDRGESLKGLIHHSDRGKQYVCYEYIKILNEYNIVVSMTENGDPLENAIAERVNGILKQEHLNFQQFNSFEQVEEVVDKAVNFYNTKRPHLSIEGLTPVQARERIGELKRKWKTHYKKKGEGEGEGKGEDSLTMETS